MGKSSINGPFSMAMLNNQRVYIDINIYIYTHTNLLPTYLPFRVFKSWVVQISPVTNQGTPVQGETSSWWFFHGVISLTFKWWFVTFKHQKCWYNGDIMTGWWCYFTILKNDGVRQWVSDDIPYTIWKIIQIFDTSNQMRIYENISKYMVDNPTTTNIPIVVWMVFSISILWWIFMSGLLVTLWCHQT